MDHYTTLGVQRTASQDEIKQAYRRLAAKHHPDRGGDTAAFQKIQQAYDTLGNDQQRAAYDQPQSPFQGFQGGGHFNFDEIFNMFGARFHAGGHQQQHRQVRMSLWITLRDVAVGGSRPVAVSTQQGSTTIEIQIPSGIEDGDSVQYPNLAPGGGDLIVTFRIQPDDRWQRTGNTVLREEPISIWTLISGGSLTITTLADERITVAIPSNTQPGTMLRVRGKGLPNRQGQPGDLIIKAQAQIPANISPQLMSAIRQETGS
jgi:curved DNA-binding protein